MADPIVLDTNIITWVARGDKDVAKALNNYVTSGTQVYISRAAYDELVTRAPTPQMAGQYREILSDMRIQIAPSGSMTDRLNLVADNIEHTPAKGQPGQIREYDRKNDPTKPGDVFVVAQAKALNAQLWSLDEDVVKRSVQFGVKLAPECSHTPKQAHPEDPVKAREWLGLKPKNIGPDGRVIPTGAIGGVGSAYTVTGDATESKTGGGSGGSKTGGGGGSGGRGGTFAYVGTPDNTLPEVGGPSARGEAIAGGIQLAFEGINFVANLINDHIQRQKIKEALDAVQPQIAKRRLENPQSGVLILFYYTQFKAPDESILKPGAAFKYLMWGSGPTRDEALEDVFRMPTISAGPGANERKFSQELWIPPLQKSAITTAKCPFPPIAIGRFVLDDSNKAKFQVVEFNVIGGFDDVFEASLELPKGRNAEFAVLKAPHEVYWYNINGKQKVEVPLKSAKTANGNEIKVVDLDPYSPFHAAAAMCFPVDEWSEKVFGTAEGTGGARILGYTNFSMIRWIRAENIHLLRFL
jgi:PIN domain nuclease of toxin-antitoxin system